MPIRDITRIFDSSLELVDLLLAFLLFMMGIYMIIGYNELENLTIIIKDYEPTQFYKFLLGVSNIKNWGLYFIGVSTVQVIKLLWATKPNIYLSVFIKANVAFSFLFLGLNNLIEYPYLISTVLFLGLSLASLFSIIKSK